MKLAVVRLNSYSPLHLGSERWRRVTKEGWPFIPGSTLYGAVVHALMKMTCDRHEMITMTECEECLRSGNSACGYALFLKEMKADSGFRFSPLVPSTHASDAAYTSKDYMRDAAAMPKTARGIQPRAPINRGSLSIHGDRLHGLEVHPALLTYRGFVHIPENLLPFLKKALRMLVLFPFGGGRGKFSHVEAVIEQEYESPDGFVDSAPPVSVRLLSPAILRGPSDLSGAELNGIGNFRMRGYRFWRTGLYADAEGENLARYGIPGSNRRHRHMTHPRIGLPEGTELRLREEPDRARDWFIEGFGDPDFARFGWGQVYWEGGENG